MVEPKWPSSFTDHQTGKWSSSFTDFHAGFFTPDTQSIYALDEMTAFDMSFDRAKLILKAGLAEETEPEYPGRLTLSFILIALLMAMFLVQQHEAILSEAGIY